MAETLRLCIQKLCVSLEPTANDLSDAIGRSACKSSRRWMLFGQSGTMQFMLDAAYSEDVPGRFASEAKNAIPTLSCRRRVTRAASTTRVGLGM